MMETSAAAAPLAAARPMENGTAASELVRLLRPHQWTKNVLVLAPLFFSHSLVQPELLAAAACAFVGFCFASSSVYIFNDLRDLQEDRLHAVKCLRPLASGRLSVSTAVTCLVFSLLLSFVCAAFLPAAFGWFLFGYLALNAAYSLGLKRVAILDVMLVASGFVLRAEAGSAAISVVCTVWLVICAFSAALTISFGKRRQEYDALMNGEPACHRYVLREYSRPSLDGMLLLSAVSALLSYASYCLDKTTAARVGSPFLGLSLPFAMFGICRFILLVYSETNADITRSILRDRPLLLNFVLWVGALIVILYLPLGSVLHE